VSIKIISVRSGKRYDRGSTLIEFTLTLLPVLALLLLTFDVTWIIFAWASIHEGVREGVRFAITRQSDASVQAVVQQYSFGFIKDSSLIKIHYLSPSNTSQDLTGANSNAAGNIVKVVVSGVAITPVGAIWRSNSPISLSASSADIIESNPNGSSRY
jgi:Flp pilus assembly protein TadG